MKGFYEEMINEIQSLVASDKAEEARTKIMTELNMPYVPSEAEAALKLMLAQLEAQQSGSFALSDEQLEAWLLGDDERRQTAAVAYLQGVNLRRYTDLVQRAFTRGLPAATESMLIVFLIDQQINESFHIVREGMDVEFVPAVLEEPMESDGVQQAVNQLREWYENDDPSFLNLCLEVLAKECYLRLPLEIDEDESLALCLAIIRYVYKANGSDDEFNCFIEEKELAQSVGYELLLNKHEL